VKSNIFLEFYVLLFLEYGLFLNMYNMYIELRITVHDIVKQLHLPTRGNKRSKLITSFQVISKMSIGASKYRDILKTGFPV
jgi:hypothetical protein